MNFCDSRASFGGGGGGLKDRDERSPGKDETSHKEVVDAALPDCEKGEVKRGRWWRLGDAKLKPSKITVASAQLSRLLRTKY